VKPLKIVPWYPMWLSASTWVPVCRNIDMQSADRDSSRLPSSPTPSGSSRTMPLGVADIQISNGGSPPAVKQGIPGKKSTARSKTRDGSTSVRTPAAVARLSIPISSSAPNGLRATFIGAERNRHRGRSAR
jgi:hypothetical protein